MISISDIVSTINKTQEVFSNAEKRKAFNRLLLLEVKHNLNLINLLKEDLKQFSTDFLSISNMFETDFLITYMTEAHGKSFKKILDKQIEIKELEKNDLISNIVLKIKILNSISILKSSGIITKKFRLKLRMENLKSKLEQLVDILELD
jgi:hypothetical protein